MYDWFRNGLAHEYFVKGRKTVVATESDPPSLPGLYEDRVLELRAVLLGPFFRAFVAGVNKWLREMGAPDAVIE